MLGGLGLVLLLVLMLPICFSLATGYGKRERIPLLENRVREVGREPGNIPQALLLLLVTLAVIFPWRQEEYGV